MQLPNACPKSIKSIPIKNNFIEGYENNSTK